MAVFIEVSRNPDNGYRSFSPAQIRRILIIGMLRTAVWSLDFIKEVIRELDHNNLEQARRMARDSLQYLNGVNWHAHARHPLFGPADRAAGRRGTKGT
ncbi:hypothetical protein HMSSN036_11260 [Paenibacillus macerans]|nr:hypothetical protein HMSSN036_11260 [Paenibacillus macerans]